MQNLRNAPASRSRKRDFYMPSFRLLSGKVRVAAAITATLIATFLGTLLAAPAGAAVTSARIIPAAFTHSGAPVNSRRVAPCNPDPFAEVSECTEVNHTGLKIRSIQGQTQNNQTPPPIRHLHIEIFYAGKKPRLIHNCGTFTLDKTGGPVCTWHNPHPNHRMQAGNYCSEVWQKDAPHHYTVLSVECIHVTRSN